MNTPASISPAYKPFIPLSDDLNSLGDTQNESIALVNLVIGEGADEFWSMIKRKSQESHNKRL